MLLIVCEFFFFLLQYYEVSTVSLQTPYRPSTAYYGLSTDSLHSTMDSLQTLYNLYSLSTVSLQPLQTLYRLSTASTNSLQLALQTLYSHTAAVLQQCCCSAVQNIKVTTGTTALQALLRHCCGTAAAPLRQTGVC